MAVGDSLEGDVGARYTSRPLRRRRNADQREAILSQAGPVTGKAVGAFHTVEGKTRRQAERARNALIVGPELLCVLSR